MIRNVRYNDRNIRVNNTNHTVSVYQYGRYNVRNVDVIIIVGDG